MGGGLFYESIVALLETVGVFLCNGEGVADETHFTLREDSHF